MGGGAPSGPAGGDLSGTYPNPTLGSGVISQTEMASPLFVSALLYDSGAWAGGAGTIDTGANGIAQTHHVLDIYILARTTQASPQSSIAVTVNNDTGANYDRQRHGIQNTTGINSSVVGQTSWSFFVHGNTELANASGYCHIFIPFYRDTTFLKIGHANDGYSDDAAADTVTCTDTVQWRSTSAITRLAVASGSGNLVAGSRVLVYGR